MSVPGPYNHMKWSLPVFRLPSELASTKSSQCVSWYSHTLQHTTTIGRSKKVFLGKHSLEQSGHIQPSIHFSDYV